MYARMGRYGSSKKFEPEPERPSLRSIYVGTQSKAAPAPLSGSRRRDDNKTERALRDDHRSVSIGTMTRRELVRLFVLNWICDNYENVDQLILEKVASMGARTGITISRPEIVDALTRLVNEGLAKAYLFASDASGEIEGMPRLDTIEEDFVTYFRATEKGMELQLSPKPKWPFDEDGNLKPGWRLSDDER